MLWKGACEKPSDVKFMETGNLAAINAVCKLVLAAANAQYIHPDCTMNKICLIPKMCRLLYSVVH